jgi:hypothetical protein
LPNTDADVAAPPVAAPNAAPPVAEAPKDLAGVLEASTSPKLYWPAILALAKEGNERAAIADATGRWAS